jgi:hypothetical protein
MIRVTIILIAVAAILTLPATAEIDGSIKAVDWAAASISGACPPINYKPAVTISNTGDEKARFLSNHLCHGPKR